MVELNERRVLDGPVDFFMTYAAHDAFSRHLGAIRSALADGKPVAARWEVLQHQLHVHHTAEDTALWPELYSALTSQDDRAVLDAMVVEHAEIDPLLERIDDAVATDDVPAAGAAVRDLSLSLGGHMRHEENEALPLVARLLRPSGWAAFGQSIRKPSRHVREVRCPRPLAVSARRGLSVRAGTLGGRLAFQATEQQSGLDTEPSRSSGQSGVTALKTLVSRPTATAGRRCSPAS